MYDRYKRNVEAIKDFYVKYGSEPQISGNRTAEVVLASWINSRRIEKMNGIVDPVLETHIKESLPWLSL